MNITDEQDTKQYAQTLARRIQPGDVVLLHGDLGAGKTTFAKYLIQALISEEIEVTSPTFTIVQTYDWQEEQIWHVDLYRLEHPDELESIGVLDAIGRQVLIVEWPGIASEHWPKSAIDVSMALRNNTRTIEIKGRYDGS